MIVATMTSQLRPVCLLINHTFLISAHVILSVSGQSQQNRGDLQFTVTIAAEIIMDRYKVMAVAIAAGYPPCTNWQVQALDSLGQVCMCIFCKFSVLIDIYGHVASTRDKHAPSAHPFMHVCTMFARPGSPMDGMQSREPLICLLANLGSLIFDCSRAREASDE